MRLEKIWKVLTKPRLEWMAGSSGVDESFTAKDILARFAVFLVAGVWISSFPVYVFIIYMHERNFFSYDFFTQGIFGLHTFVAMTAFIILLFAMVFYGSILSAKAEVTEKKYKGKSGYRSLTWFMFLSSALMHYYMFILSLKHGNPFVFIWVVVTSFFVCMFFYSFVGNGFRRNLKNWCAPVLFMVASVYIPFMFREASANAVSVVLMIFKVGGGVHAEIQEMEGGGRLVSGELMLMAPNNAYMKNEKGGLVVVPLSERTTITIK